MALAAGVHDFLGAAETVDRFGDEAMRPGLARALDLPLPIAAGAFGVVEDARVGRRQRWVGEQRSGGRHRAVRQIDRRRCRPVRTKELGDRGDGGVGALDQRIAVLRVPDCRRQHLAQRQRAIVAQHQHPGRERAGHAGGKKAGAGHEIEAFAAIMGDGGAGRRRSLAADHFRLAAAHVVDDGRHVAAGAVEMRLDHLQHESGRDRRIERVAAFFQRRHADGGGYPVGRGDDAERAFDFRTRRERVGIDDAHAAM
jgi:hypothetical protein